MGETRDPDEKGKTVENILEDLGLPSSSEQGNGRPTIGDLTDMINSGALSSVQIEDGQVVEVKKES